MNKKHNREDIMKKELNYKLIAIGNNIREIRKTKGITQEELAEALDLSVMTVSRIENGNTAINVLVLIQLTKILDTCIDQILNLDTTI
jgi:transcriptional regulator with XRE-family HTH domain